MDNEVSKKDTKNGVKYSYKEDVSQGEYFILNRDILEFYSKENTKFTSTNKIPLI